MPIYETESNPTATFNPKLLLAREPKTQANTQILSFHLIPNVKKSDPFLLHHSFCEAGAEAPLANFFFFPPRLTSNQFQKRKQTSNKFNP